MPHFLCIRVKNITPDLQEAEGYKEQRRYTKLDGFSLNDIHMHIIPGVDDGARDKEEALAMLMLARQQGVKAIIATPHSSAFAWKGQVVWKHFRALQEYMTQAFPDLRLFWGSEVFCTEKTMPSVLADLKSGKLPSMNGTAYVLTEFSTAVSGNEAIACVKKLRAQNWLPIIAHIERYPALFKEPNVILEMIKNDCLIQVNVYSVYSEPNESIRDNARILFDREWVHFLGSDAHRIDHRPPRVKEGLQYLYGHYDKKYIDRIAAGNAEAFLNLGKAQEASAAKANGGTDGENPPRENHINIRRKGMQTDNIHMLDETLHILNDGRYQTRQGTVPLKLSRERMEASEVLLPEDVRAICERTDFERVFTIGRCGLACENADSFSVAIELYPYLAFLYPKESKEVLVLNMANPVHPGGGVRRGVRAQEEDLCRRSSLLLSLESAGAQKYYKFNRSLQTKLGSDAMILSPKVEIIRDENGELLPETSVVAVLTCAAPVYTAELGGLSSGEYREMFYQRILSMLKCAAFWGYKALVLGAWGCGAFGNDAKMVSDLFYKALKEMNYNGMVAKDFFHCVNFAVLDRSSDQYNFTEFSRNFTPQNFYRDENQAEIDAALRRKAATEVNLDKIRGCLFGGAVGDALGYPVEFMGERTIFSRYGDRGIQEYALDSASGKALISDDTQMTLFTANGLLHGDTRGCMRGIQAAPHCYVGDAYLDWLRTQDISFAESRKFRGNCYSWLCEVPELYSRRAPGMTCLSALRREKSEPVSNNSKGCGGIMRVAPLALNYPKAELKWLDAEGSRIAAITHGHSLGQMPAAALTHILHRIVYPQSDLTLKEIILEARNMMTRLYSDDPYLKELTDIMELAITLSENNDSDLDNIHRLGEGWVAEETLGIALYCSLRYENDFSAGVIAAVNHRGDSDSTGAVTGNILGALAGYERIEEKWKEKLELADVILEIADDICHGCQMNEYSVYRDPDWERKYIDIFSKYSPQETVFEAVLGDITKDHGVDAIVNSANRKLLSGSGVNGAIHRAAGSGLLEECRRLHGCETGEAKLTRGYLLPCQYVIHTLGPVWHGGRNGESELLASCYRSCLEMAAAHGIRSIAFPSISTGLFGFPVEEAAKVAVKTAEKFVVDHPDEIDRILWVLSDEKTYASYEQEIKR